MENDLQKEDNRNAPVTQKKRSPVLLNCSWLIWSWINVRNKICRLQRAWIISFNTVCPSSGSFWRNEIIWVRVQFREVRGKLLLFRYNEPNSYLLVHASEVVEPQHVVQAAGNKARTSGIQRHGCNIEILKFYNFSYENRNYFAKIAFTKRLKHKLLSVIPDIALLWPLRVASWLIGRSKLKPQ